VSLKDTVQLGVPPSYILWIVFKGDSDTETWRTCTRQVFMYLTYWRSTAGCKYASTVSMRLRPTSVLAVKASGVRIPSAPHEGSNSALTSGYWTRA
jgi:hypothetical protein